MMLHVEAQSALVHSLISEFEAFGKEAPEFNPEERRAWVARVESALLALAQKAFHVGKFMAPVARRMGALNAATGGFLTSARMLHLAESAQRLCGIRPAVPAFRRIAAIRQMGHVAANLRRRRVPLEKAQERLVRQFSGDVLEAGEVLEFLEVFAWQ